MINPVLCVNRDAVIKAIGTPHLPINGAYALNIRDIDESEYHLLNRSIADSKDPNYHALARQLPQVLPYVIVKCEGEVLTYSRAKGQEDRLHGNLSCGFGGHVDMGDVSPTHFNLAAGIMRELKEELRLDDTKPFELTEMKVALIDETNEVGRVHLGYVYELELSTKDIIDPDLNEIHLPEWKNHDQLLDELDRYENWSQTLITHLESN